MTSADLMHPIVRLHLTTKSGKKVTYEYDERKASSNMIQFEVNFSDDAERAVNTVSIFNLNRANRDHIRKGCHVVLEAGYLGDVGIIAEGHINRTYNYYGDLSSSGDLQADFSFVDGPDYSKIKFKKTRQRRSTNKKSKLYDKFKTAYPKISFKKGTKASTIIKRVSEKSGVSVSVKKLKVDKEYKKGYTVEGSSSIVDILQEVADSCKSSLYCVRGKLVINDIKSGKYSGVEISEASGLIGFPQPIEDDDVHGYTVTMMLQYRITTASTFKLHSRYAKGIYHVKSGTHSFGGGSFTTEVEAV